MRNKKSVHDKKIGPSFLSRLIQRKQLGTREARAHVKKDSSRCNVHGLRVSDVQKAERDIRMPEDGKDEGR